MVLLLMTLAIWLVGMLGAFVPLLVASYNKVALAMCNSFAAGEWLSRKRETAGQLRGCSEPSLKGRKLIHEAAGQSEWRI